MDFSWKEIGFAMNFNTIIDNQILNLEISAYLNQFNVQINNNLQKIDCVPLSNNAYSLILKGKTYLLTINPKIDKNLLFKYYFNQSLFSLRNLVPKRDLIWP